MARIYNSVAFPFESPYLIASFDGDDGCNRFQLVHDMHLLYVGRFAISLGIFIIIIIIIIVIVIVINSKSL